MGDQRTQDMCMHPSMVPPAASSLLGKHEQPVQIRGTAALGLCIDVQRKKNAQSLAGWRQAERKPIQDG